MGHEITDEYIYLNCSKKNIALKFTVYNFFSILDISLGMMLMAKDRSRVLGS